MYVKRGIDGKVWAKYSTSSWTPVECEDDVTVGALRKAIKLEFPRMLDGWDAAQLVIKLENGTALDSEASISTVIPFVR